MMDARYYWFLHGMMFADDYPGYRPNVREVPNGDGKIDADKRFSHIATKYLSEEYKETHRLQHIVLQNALIEAHSIALRIAEILGVPSEFMPRYEYGAIRLLDYPPGAVSNLHTDPNLFTVMLYRDKPECFVPHDHDPFGASVSSRTHSNLLDARAYSPQLHLGEMAEQLGIGLATPHEVVASDRSQHSAVYFAIPDWKAVLPCGQTVKEFLDERLYARGRVEVRP